MSRKQSTYNPQQTSMFILFIAFLFGLAYVVRPIHDVAAWFGFFIAAYSAIANDSIQTIGTFISSNKHRPWWQLWVFISTVFFITVMYSWLAYSGDVSSQRLLAKGFDQSPKHFEYLQIAAPIVLLILTYARMPVSTTFLLLGAFAASSSAVGKVLFKSVSGYFLAFAVGLIAFAVIAKICKRYFKGKPSAGWVITQWIVSGLLWSVWLQQDLANIAVFLPRSLAVWEFSLFCGSIIIGLGILLYHKGGGIQVIVTQKSYVTDARFVTMIDGVYALILYYFKIQSKKPMSTTWVFLGLLAGREFAMKIRGASPKTVLAIMQMSITDVAKAVFGLIISIWVAVNVNPSIELSKIQSSFQAQAYKLLKMK